MKMYKDQKGVTLLELIVGLVLFGIIAAGFTTALIPSLQNMMERSQQPEDWLHEARSCAEALVAEREVEEGECSDSFFNDICNYSSIECVADPGPEPEPEDGFEYCEITIRATNNDDINNIVLRLDIEENND